MARIQGRRAIIPHDLALAVAQVPIRVRLDSAGIGIGHEPQARVQAFRFDVAGNPFRPVREFLLVPMLDPIMAFLEPAIIAIVDLHILKSIGLEVGSEPIGVPDNGLLRDVAVITGPTAPHHRCPVEDGIIQTRVPRHPEHPGVILRNQPHQRRPGNRHEHVESVGAPTLLILAGFAP